MTTSEVGRVNSPIRKAAAHPVSQVNCSKRIYTCRVSRQEPMAILAVV